MTANFCGSCGATLLSGTKFCPACGKPVAHAGPPPANAPAPGAQPPEAAPAPVPPAPTGATFDDEGTQIRQAYSPPPPPPPANRRLWIALGSAVFAVLVLAGVTVAVLDLKGSDDKGGKTASPEAQAQSAVRNAYDNYYFGKCEAATKYIDGPHDDVVSQCQGEKRDVAKIDVGSATINGTKATVKVVVTRVAGSPDKSPVDLSVDLVKTTDGWKVGWQ